jgi:hypothetical protein
MNEALKMLSNSIQSLNVSLNNINREDQYDFQIDEPPLPSIDELIVCLSLISLAKSEYDKIKDIEILDLVVNGTSNVVGY